MDIRITLPYNYAGELFSAWGPETSMDDCIAYVEEMKAYIEESFPGHIFDYWTGSLSVVTDPEGTEDTPEHREIEQTVKDIITGQYGIPDLIWERVASR
jgi:hypothetical protein